MGLAVVHSRAIDGLRAEPVRVEVHVANGLPCLTLVGLADTEVREARERVRSALIHSGLGYPTNQRITVSLAPADLPKESGRFDLPIALGILAAQGLLDPRRLDEHEFAGELSLAGELQPVRGALALALGLQRQSGGSAHRHLVLPEASAGEAAQVPGVVVLQARDLLQVVRALEPQSGSAPLQRAAPKGMAAGSPSAAGQGSGPVCLRDVRGQGAAKRALEVAAAGHHSLLLVGPPGSGKSMLAQRLPGLLPPLTDAQALDCAAMASIAGAGAAGPRWGQRPWRAPHHSSSAAALVGGGNPPRPGEMSLADHGVLFLDELPEFTRRALESLREPLETGQVSLSRAGRQAHFPCRVLLVAAMNPCPCGWLGQHSAGTPACRCTADAVARYQGRLSGPLLDRIDLQLHVAASATPDLLSPPQGPSSAEVAQRAARARDRQLARQGCCNADLPAAALGTHAPLQASAHNLLNRAGQRLGMSGRSLHRVVRIARTLADLADEPAVGAEHLAEALQLRRALLAEPGRPAAG